MSVFTDIAAEGILLAGGGRAILMQIADPAVGAGVAAHSGFADRPLERLANTVTYAYATVFATPAELAAVVRRVNHAHGPVVSRPATSAGSTAAPVSDAEIPYNAFDQHAQLWVAATLYQTALLVYEKTFGELDPHDAEDVYQRYGVLGSALQMPPGLWPADLAAFRRYWDAAVAELRVTDAARRVAHDLLHPRTGPLWLRAAMPLVRLVTTGLLDENLRRAFVLPWSPRSQRRFDRLFRAAALLYPRLPRALRRLPRDRYMSALRASLAAEPAPPPTPTDGPAQHALRPRTPLTRTTTHLARAPHRRAASAAPRRDANPSPASAEPLFGSLRRVKASGRGVVRRGGVRRSTPPPAVTIKTPLAETAALFASDWLRSVLVDGRQAPRQDRAGDDGAGAGRATERSPVKQERRWAGRRGWSGGGGSRAWERVKPVLRWRAKRRRDGGEAGARRAGSRWRAAQQGEAGAGKGRRGLCRAGEARAAKLARGGC